MTVINNNGVIRVGRKGKKKFAFGENGTPFEVDVVQAFQAWVDIDNAFRDTPDKTISANTMREYHTAAVKFAKDFDLVTDITTAEALEFLAQLREQYDELAVFFQPKSRIVHESPATSGQALLFSEEENSQTSTN